MRPTKKALILLLIQIGAKIFAGEPVVVGSPEPVRAAVGDDVVLQCHLEPPINVKDLMVEWKHGNGSTAHVYRNGRDDLQQPVERFRGRTSLLYDEMTGGNTSLKLTNVTEEDSGEFTCFIPNVGKGRVLLVVGGDKEPEDDEKQTKNGATGLVLSSVWVPLIFAALAVNIWYVTGTFELNQTQSLYEAVENQTITLEWTFTIRRPPRYYQVYCEHITGPRISVVLHVEQGDQNPDSQDPDFTGRVQFDEEVFREGRLRVHVSRLQTTDSGLYRCEVMTEYGPSVGKCRLIVSAAANETQTLRPGPEGPGPERPGPKIRGRTGLVVALGLTVVLLVVAAAAAGRKCLNNIIINNNNNKTTTTTT
ncbi:uncharacterized protein V6R79_018683 [Siganus canaliculatus]